MAQLLRHSRTVTIFFDLLGWLDNDMTDALAFTLSRSSAFLCALLADLGYRGPFDEKDAVLSVQTRRPAEGITDLEIQIANSFFAILEAKRGSGLPTESQLKLCAPVVTRRAASTKMLVAVTPATPTFAAASLAGIELSDVTLTHRSWRQLRSLAVEARPRYTNDGKRLLDQFVNYIEGILGMDIRYDNQVFIVSLGAGNPDGWWLSWIDVVRQFHILCAPVTQRISRRSCRPQRSDR